MRKMIDILFEAYPGQGDTNEIHIFDFDETLAVTSSSTLHVGVEFDGTAWKPIPNYIARMKKALKALNATDVYSWNEAVSGAKISASVIKDLSSAIQGGKIKPGYQDPALVGCEVVLIGTHGYKAFKELVGLGGLKKVQAHRPAIWASHSDMISNTNFPTGTELHITDYSPAASLGSAIPIPINIETARVNKQEGDIVGVVTARKGRNKMDSLGGPGTVSALNVSEIESFMENEHSVPLDFAYGAADVDNDGAINKAFYIKNAWLRSNKRDLYFYDDDKANLNAILDYIPDDPEVLAQKPGATIRTYFADNFLKSETHELHREVVVGQGAMMNQRVSKPKTKQDFIDKLGDEEKGTKAYYRHLKNLRKMAGSEDLLQKIAENDRRKIANARIVAETVKYLASNSRQRRVLREACDKKQGRMMDYGHQRSDSGEGKMTKAKLFRMAQMAQRLHDKIFGYDDLPEWVQDKVTTAEDRLKTAHDYILYKIWRMENE